MKRILKVLELACLADTEAEIMELIDAREETERLVAGRSLEEKEFFCVHGYWPQGEDPQMTSFKNRVQLLERESRFRDWLRNQGFYSPFTIQQLEDAAAFDCWPEQLPPEPAPGTSFLNNRTP